MSFHSWLTWFVSFRSCRRNTITGSCYICMFWDVMHANTSKITHGGLRYVSATFPVTPVFEAWNVCARLRTNTQFSFIHTLPRGTKQWVTGLTWRSHLLPFHLTASVMRHLFRSYKHIAIGFENQFKVRPKSNTFWLTKWLDQNKTRIN